MPTLTASLQLEDPLAARLATGLPPETILLGETDRELDPVSLRLHQELKRVFDPTGILNPGKVLA